MGVQGLMSHCLQRRDQCMEEVDLVEVARAKGGIELLVDFYSFEHLIIKRLWKGLSELRQNEYLRLIGAEYRTIDTFITKLVKDLESVGIGLVFGIDGAKGSSREVTENKLDTWISRHKQDMYKFRDLLDVCRGVANMSDMPDSTSVRPVLLEPQILKTLRRCGCEIIQCAAGEADFILAKTLVSREKAYAVVSNDSDFCIFLGCSFIPNDMFDIENDLQLGAPVAVPEKPLRLKVGVISTFKVMDMLGFSHHSLMVELSIVGGNDFTGSFMRTGSNSGLLFKLDIDGRPTIEGIANWVRRYKRVENHPAVSKLMSTDSKFEGTILHSRQFYSLDHPGEQPAQRGDLSNLIVEGIQQGLFPANVMSMHNNFYWHRMLLEDNSPRHPCIEMVLAELRGYVYRLVFHRHAYFAMEYGRSPYEELKESKVYAAASGPNVPTLGYVKQNKVFQNLRFFHHIMSHQEPGREINYFDRYGRKNGFVCYILRYFLILNWGRNLNVTEKEFLALLAVAFGRPNESQYQEICLRPTLRSLTIANWFQDIYRHGYLFLGHLLYISHEFPEPMELFCGSAWIAFHTVSDDEAWYHGVRQVRQEILQKVQRDMNAIIKEKRHVIRYIVDGCFEFDDRW